MSRHGKVATRRHIRMAVHQQCHRYFCMSSSPEILLHVESRMVGYHKTRYLSGRRRSEESEGKERRLVRVQAMRKIHSLLEYERGRKIVGAGPSIIQHTAGSIWSRLENMNHALQLYIVESLTWSLTSGHRYLDNLRHSEDANTIASHR